MTNSNYNLFFTQLKKSFSSYSLINVVFSNFDSSSDVIKIKGQLRQIGDNICIQFEHLLKEGRLEHKNVDINGLEEYLFSIEGLSFKRVDINDKLGNASYLISKKGKTTFINNIKNLVISNNNSIEILGNNKDKNYILNGSEDFLILLGISDKNGRVHDKKQSKYRQICKFLETVSSIVDFLPKNEKIYISDMCCGKSYLSFAVYYFFTYILNREVCMECVDLKESVINECKQIAAHLKYYSMLFKCEDISTYKPANKPNLVLSLHACDTATDLVLDYAIKNDADVILSTPCCHRALSKIINCDELSFITNNSVFNSKFCEVATDAMRTLRLKSKGYKTDAFEFVSVDDTPKNILIKAIKSKDYDPTSDKYKSLEAQYNRFYDFLVQ